MEAIGQALELIFNFAGETGLLFPVVGSATVLIATLVDILKQVGLVKDGQAPKWAAIFNAVIWVALYWLGVFELEAEATEVLALLNEVAPAIAGFLVVLGVTPKLHDYFASRKRWPFYSHDS